MGYCYLWVATVQEGKDELPNECLVYALEPSHTPNPLLHPAFNVNLFAICTQTLVAVFQEHRCTPVGMVAAQINSATECLVCLLKPTHPPCPPSQTDRR